MMTGIKEVVTEHKPKEWIKEIIQNDMERRSEEPKIQNLKCMSLTGLINDIEKTLRENNLQINRNNVLFLFNEYLYGRKGD